MFYVELIFIDNKTNIYYVHSGPAPHTGEKDLQLAPPIVLDEFSAPIY